MPYAQNFPNSYKYNNPDNVFKYSDSLMVRENIYKKGTGINQILAGRRRRGST
jgi:hypothetical protein